MTHQVQVDVNFAGEVPYVQHTAVKAHGKWDGREQEKAEIMERRCYVCTEQTKALYTGKLSSASYRHSMRRKEDEEEEE